MMIELRIDPITQDIVVFSEDRLKRPISSHSSKEIENMQNDNKDCPFCRKNEAYCEKYTYKIEDKNGWLVKSVYNKFPIINQQSDYIYGRHEVMVDTYRHSGSFYDMSILEYKNLFRMYKNRYIDFINDNKIEYISIFKNFKREAGASLDHPHSQIISLSFIPPEIKKEIIIAQKYYEENNKCLYKKLIEDEIKLDERVVHNSDMFLIIIPYATKYTGEIRIIFKQKIDFHEIDESHIKELAIIFKKLFKSINDENGCISFNLYIHGYPNNIKCKEYFNTHIHIIPRKYNVGGFELSTGAYVSSIKPENLAKKLKF